VFLLTVTPVLKAQETHWIGGTGDWFEQTNWTLGVLPISSDYVYITNGGEARIAAYAAEAYRLLLGYGTGESGALTQTGGTNTVGNCLYLGYSSSSEGTYELSGTGSLSADDEFIGQSGTGTFTQTGGTNTIANYLYLGSSSTGEGTYKLSGTGSLSADDEYIGSYGGTGTFTQTGGTNTVGDCLYLAYYSGGEGTYELSGTGSLSAHSEYIGHYGTGTFTQTGGTNTVSEDLKLGNWPGSKGTYELSGTGSLSAYSESIGNGWGTGTFTQTGGTNTIGDDLFLGGHSSGSEGMYELSGTGSLSAKNEYIGDSVTGTFTQTGGTNTIGWALHLARNSGGEGTYELSGTGSLSAEREYIGIDGTGTFTQTGGTNTIAAVLCLGYSSGSGAYTISAGNLSAADFIVGRSGGSGTLKITDSAANITVSNLLHWGGDSTLTAVPGATIHMTGAAFENESTDPAVLDGLANLELIFEGGLAITDSFEVAGRDFGAVAQGWIENFVLGGLTLGGADAGRIQLIDFFDNQPDWEGQEALYVEDLAFVGPGSGVDLNGLNMYFRNGADPKQFFCGDADLNGKVDGGDLAIWQQNYDPLGLNLNTYPMGDFNGDGKIDGGDLATWQQNYNPLGFKGSGLVTAAVNPEPASLCLLALGAAALLGWRRFHLIPGPPRRAHGDKLTLTRGESHV
jgi:hypothetical protein